MNKFITAVLLVAVSGCTHTEIGQAKPVSDDVVEGDSSSFRRVVFDNGTRSYYCNKSASGECKVFIYTSDCGNGGTGDGCKVQIVEKLSMGEGRSESVRSTPSTAYECVSLQNHESNSNTCSRLSHL